MTGYHCFRCGKCAGNPQYRCLTQIEIPENQYFTAYVDLRIAAL